MFLKEGGKALENVSQIPREFLEPTIKFGLEEVGLQDIKYSPVGNISEKFSNDIDLSVDVNSIAELWNLPKPYYSDAFWDAIKERVAKIPGAVYQPGLKQFHIPFKIVNKEGIQQPIYKDGKPIEGTLANTQVDFFVGKQDWMKDILSGKPEGSGYKAVFRNVLIGSTISTIGRRTTEPDAEGNFEEIKHVLNFKSGVERVTTKYRPPKGKEKNPKVLYTTRQEVLNDQNEMAESLFGGGYSWQDINSFEKVMNEFLNNKFFNENYGEYKETILKKFKETLKPEQLKILLNSEYGQYFQSSLNEGREGIGRFAGTSEFKSAELLELLQKLAQEADAIGKENFEVDLLKSKSIDMVEKMDAAFVHFGINKDSEFFMESNYSGEVTIKTVDNPAFKDKKEVFIYLNENKQFQKSLREIATINGELQPIRFDAELFPVMLMSKGTEDITFASTRYKRNKLGKSGAFVIFKCAIWDEEKKDWKRPPPEISERYISGLKKRSSIFEEDWKIYSNDEDMRLPGILKIELGPVAKLLKPENFSNTINILKSRKKEDSEKRASTESMLNGLRKQLQDSLDEYANKARSKLGDNKSAVEGVVLRIKTPDGEVYEVKGTSQKFAEQANIIWEERKAIDMARKSFNKLIKTSVLGMANEPDSATLEKIKTSLSSPDNNAKTKSDFFNLMINATVPNYTQTLTTISDNLKLALKQLSDAINLPRTSKEGKTLPPLRKSFESKKEFLDQDSIRKTESYFKSVDDLLNSYGAISKKRNQQDKFFLTFKEYFKEEFPALLPDVKKSEEPMTRVILWYGRAQPWHKGHDAMIKLGKQKLSQFKSEKIVLMIAKGEESSKDLAENPLKENEQIELINALYGSDSQIEIVSDVFPTDGYGVLDIASTKNYLITAWLAGDDRIKEYQRLITSFDKERFLFNHNNVVFDLDESGKALAQMIPTPRVFSGTKSRTLVKNPEYTFEKWFAEIAPEKTSSSAKKVYEKIYNIMKERIPDQPIQEIVLSVLNEQLQKKKDKYSLVSKKIIEMLSISKNKKNVKEKQVRYFQNLKEMSGMGSGAVAIGAQKNWRRRQ
jgi:hypothetical protein